MFPTTKTFKVHNKHRRVLNNNDGKHTSMSPAHSTCVMGVHYFSNFFKTFDVFLLIPLMPLCVILLEKRKTHMCQHKLCYTRSLE